MAGPDAAGLVEVESARPAAPTSTPPRRSFARARVSDCKQADIAPDSFARGCECSTLERMPERDTCDLLCLDAPKAEAIRRALPKVAALEVLARGAKACGDTTRLTIALALLDGAPLCVCDVGFIVGRDEKLVSHHLRSLKTAGLARSHRDGKMVMYELTEAGKQLLEGLLAARDDGQDRDLR